MTDIRGTSVVAPNRSYGYNVHSYHHRINARNEKIDLNNLPNSIKNMIMTQCEAKLKHYDPVKVCTRSDTKYTAIDTRQKITARKKRLQVHPTYLGCS